MTALDIIREWQRRPFSGVDAPWQHELATVRAMWQRMEMRLAAQTLNDCGPEPSATKDWAGDLLDKATNTHRRIIQSAWDARCMERGYVPAERNSTRVLELAQ